MPERKNIRLEGYDYSQAGAYFLTLCADQKKPIFGKLVGDGVLDIPSLQATEFGKILENTLREISSTYKHLSVEKYVIMPNHVHMIVVIDQPPTAGMSGTPSPTGGVHSHANDAIPAFISTLKRFTNKRCGTSVWQRGYYDHVIRNEDEFKGCWNYIEGNPSKWQADDLWVST